MPSDEAKWEATIRGRLQTLLGLDGDPAGFDSLKVEAARRLGPVHSVTFLIESSGQFRRSYSQSAEEAVVAWAGIRRRAQDSLADSDPTLMAIRSYHARFLGLRGRRADLDEAVKLRRDELSLRARILSADDNMIGIARADLAAALVDRSRTCIQDPDGPCDVASVRHLAEAEELIKEETLRRSGIFTPRNSFSQHSNGILAALLVALAEHAPKPQRTAYASRSLTITRELIDFYWEQGDTRSFNLLKSQLHYAESLTLLERFEEAARAARQAYLISDRGRRNFDRGWSAFVLAKAQLPTDKAAAMQAAGEARALRLQVFPLDSCRVLEVERFIENLRLTARAAARQECRAAR
jgi:hypothetical protein